MFTNPSNVSLYLSLWLTDDDYDHVFDPAIVTATELLKPIKSLVLTRRLMQEASESGVSFEENGDISSRIPARMGQAIHQAVEDSWTQQSREDVQEKLRQLGYPERLVNKLQINPPADNDGFNLYLEQRTNKVIGNYVVSGKYDAVIDGVVIDLKTTSTFTYVKGSNNRRYALQGSIYRWLNPDIITSELMVVQFLFTDWSPLRAQQDENYPQNRAVTKELPLFSVDETEAYIQERIAALDMYTNASQQEMPACTPVELWMDPSKYAYYADPHKTQRATKLFDNPGDAYAYRDQKGKGIVMERKSEPTFCRYCPANQACLQAQAYQAESLLKL